MRRRARVASGAGQIAALSDFNQHVATVVGHLVTAVLRRTTTASKRFDSFIGDVIVPGVGCEQRRKRPMFWARLIHKDTVVSFKHISRNSSHTRWAKARRGFNECPLSKFWRHCVVIMYGRLRHRFPVASSNECVGIEGDIFWRIGFLLSDGNPAGTLQDLSGSCLIADCQKTTTLI